MTAGEPRAFLDPRGAPAHGIRTKNPEGAQTKAAYLTEVLETVAEEIRIRLQ
jgi:hypothetical protein